MRAIQKYGTENFIREILDYAYSQEELNKLEKYYIKKHNAVKDRNFYNIHVGGIGGDTYSGKSEQEKEEYKQKISDLTSGDKNGMYGKHHTEETRKIIGMKRKENKKVYQTKEYRQKISSVTKGEKNGMYGKHHSEQTKKIISEKHMGKGTGINNGMYGKRGENALNGKKVYQYLDKDKTILVNIFNSVRCVLEFFNIKNHTGLDKSIKNNKPYKGYYWSKEKKV